MTITTICSWCGEWMYAVDYPGGADNKEDKKISHGMCPKCVEKENKKLDKLEAESKLKGD